MIVEAMMPPASMALFYLLQLLTLLIRELGGHLVVRVCKNPANPLTGVSPNISQLGTCLIDDRRNFCELFRSQVEFGAESFFHSAADPLGMAQFKEMMQGI